MATSLLENAHGIRLYPSGPGRFFTSGFLVFWLCGWAAGEIIVIGILIGGAWRMLSGDLEPSPAHLGAGAFLAFWLTFWTIGGLTALREVLRNLWAEDRLLMRPPGLRVERRVGPLRRYLEIARHELRHVHVALDSKNLVAETDTGETVLSSLGTIADREEVAIWLSNELGLDRKRYVPEHVPLELPENWVEVGDGKGGIAIVANPELRGKHGRTVLVIAAVSGIISVVFGYRAYEAQSLAGFTIPAFVTTAILVALGIWMLRGRTEWCPQNGLLVIRRRFGNKTWVLFEGTELELSNTTDSDGDDYYQLEALGPLHGSEASKERPRHVVHSQPLGMPETRALAEWLAYRASIPLHDRMTENRSRSADIAEVRAQLESQGRLGRLISSVLARYEKKP